MQKTINNILFSQFISIIYYAAKTAVQKTRRDYNKNNYYVFLVNKSEKGDKNGIMPFNRHFGFIFTGDKPTETKLFRTIAHELGHGAFKLKHNFDDKKTEKRSTKNLMDYLPTANSQQPTANFTVLRKYQWDEIISPRAIAFGWSEELYAEEEGVSDEFTIFYNFHKGYGLEQPDEDKYSVLARQLRTETERMIGKGVLVNFVEMELQHDGYAIGMLSPDEFYKEKKNSYFKNVDIVFFYGVGGYFGFKFQPSEFMNNELHEMIENSCNYYSNKHTGVHYRRCLIEIVLEVVSNYFGITNFRETNCQYKIEYNEESEDETTEEPEGVVENKEISNITTFIDLEGNVTISWENPNPDCKTILRYSVPSKNISNKEIYLSSYTNTDYSYTIPKSDAGREAVVNYSISITNKLEEEFFALQEETGNFQGQDQGACPGQYVNIGNKTNNDKTEYTYKWTDNSDNEVTELGNNSNSGRFGFYIKEAKILKLKREKTGVIDIALVNIVAKEEGCDWTLSAIDEDPPPESGDRKINENETLEVVKDAKYSIPNGVKSYVSDASYGIGEPVWKEEETVIPNPNPNNDEKQLDVIINTSKKSANSITEISAQAFSQTKKVNIKIFKKDSKIIPKSKLNLTLDKFCNMINNVNDRLNFMKLGSPLSCTVDSKVYSYNAEKYSSPIVVREEKGDVPIGINASASISIPPLGTPQMKISISGGGAVVFVYDKRERIDSNPIMPPKKISGSQISVGLKVCGTVGASFYGYTLLEGGICGEGAILFDFNLN